jgi:hypothetical protein
MLILWVNCTGRKKGRGAIPFLSDIGPQNFTLRIIRSNVFLLVFKVDPLFVVVGVVVVGEVSFVVMFAGLDGVVGVDWVLFLR